MKTLVICLMALIASSTAFSQKNGAPAVVKNAFKAKYPEVTNPKWEAENGKYEAEFKVNGVETSVVIDKSGKIVETEKHIDIANLPSKATTYIANNFKGMKIKEASKIVSSSGKVTYEAEVGKNDVMFDSNGNFTGITKKDKDDSEDED